ncbi:Dam family site-specific DNA-(adenine-N6)-methyltransferase [Peribacillus frigoritolerans]|uniref:Dam family site-specific DNA-(adenine-N6)-methyltransferase n=1 Tax=Peribacillus frigoritolerans TaxID=450367 RepID=UPI00207A43E5|nr:Dam family site-specific DNA-(adenine-N6)-methyltransferase [Peribacillus frigoritolerans]USK78939.1 Dam family site-specific DNA-(adenine-N6)-methyltransferase [Peribacillus frigoritolerans]
MQMPHPIPYQGSKRNIAKDILPYIPIGTHTMIESFAGSAAISIAAGYQHKVEKFILSDLNSPLMEIWKQIVNEPLVLSENYKKLWEEQLGQEKEFYLKVREEFNKNPRPDQLLYLLARCVKNAVRYNDKGEFNQGSDNRRKGRKPDKMEREIMGAHKILSTRTELYSIDYTEVNLKAEQNDVIYMDPPYQGTVKSSKRYIKGLELDSFISHLEDLNDRNLSYIISFDGRTGEKIYGEKLPNHLQLKHIEVNAGRSSQATLLGRSDETVESVYLSQALVERLQNNNQHVLEEVEQLQLFGGQ